MRFWKTESIIINHTLPLLAYPLGDIEEKKDISTFLCSYLQAQRVFVLWFYGNRSRAATLIVRLSMKRNISPFAEIDTVPNVSSE